MTGGARGIGAAIVRALIDEDFTVIVADLDLDDPGYRPEHQRSDGGRVIAVQADLHDPKAAHILAGVVDSRCGGELHVLVNNAGIGSDQPFYEMADGAFERLLDIDLAAPFRVTRECWPALTKVRGAVVNISSIHGSRPLPGGAAYAAAKGGLENLTRAMALDAAPHGVRVNAVAPGFVSTRAWSNWLGDRGTDAASEEAKVRATIPLGRPAMTDEIAQAVLWLTSPAASYTTGTVLALDGGVMAQAFHKAWIG